MYIIYDLYDYTEKKMTQKSIMISELMPGKVKISNDSVEREQIKPIYINPDQSKYGMSWRINDTFLAYKHNEKTNDPDSKDSDDYDPKYEDRYKIKIRRYHTLNDMPIEDQLLIISGTQVV